MRSGQTTTRMLCWCRLTAEAEWQTGADERRADGDAADASQRAQPHARMTQEYTGGSNAGGKSTCLSACSCASPSPMLRRSPPPPPAQWREASSSGEPSCIREECFPPRFGMHECYTGLLTSTIQYGIRACRSVAEFAFVRKAFGRRARQQSSRAFAHAEAWRNS
jgi:hypothetical protein